MAGNAMVHGLAPPRQITRATFISRLGIRAKMRSHRNALTRRVCLTFDDGPSEATTPQLLDHLKALGIKATFFVVGQKVATAEGSAIAERIAAEGHQIGNHSYNHPNLTRLDSAEIEREISETEELIGRLDRGVKLFRPPFGLRNQIVDRVAEALGYKSVLWNVNTQDWRRYYQNRRWVAHALNQIASRPECIVLAHDVHSTTVENIPALVAAIQKMPKAKFALLPDPA
jgi:peptidoglycan/xylan/chitin deacetylase (PgdA/CDA1 family)